MLFPQFSLRMLLATITGCSLVFLVVSFAVRGHTWAVGIAIALLSIVVTAFVHAAMFFLLWIFATITRRRGKVNAQKIVVVLATTFITATASAAGGLVALPSTGKPAANGMLLHIDTTWPQGLGYRPVTISVACVPPVNADRTLSIEFRSHDWNPRKAQLRVTTELEVPAGAAAAKTTLAIPDFNGWQSYSIDVWEDGRHKPELSGKSLGAAAFNSGSVKPSVLFVTATSPNVTALSAIFPQPAYYNVNQANAGGVILPNEWASLAATALPEDWLCYQNLDVICISLADWEGLQSTKIGEAIRNWTRAGGNLFVYGVGDDWNGLAAIEQSLQLPKLTADSSEAEAQRGWSKPVSSNYHSLVVDPSIQVPSAAPAVVVDGEVDDETTAPEKSSPPDPKFVWRAAQFGSVVAIAPADPYATFSQSEWGWIFNDLGGGRWIGAKRAGINFTNENNDFWTFVIPGVGGAPVDAYRVLITVFVVLIGPVNYLLLRRHGRLHMLLFTVPASAILVTAALLGYALIADGLHTRARSRSITLLDQGTGDAVSWSRLAYYAGLAPSAGLRFAPGTAVIPYDQLPIGSGRGREVTRNIAIDGEGQQLKSGWLASRTPTQLLTTRPYPSPQKLLVSSSGGTDGPATTHVENQLGTAIRQLLLCSEPGAFGYGANIPAGGKLDLETLSAKNEAGGPDVNPQLRFPMLQAFSEQAPKLPPGFDANNFGGLFGLRRNWMYYGNNNNLEVTQATGRLESTMNEALTAVSQASGLGPASLKPRSYIAIVDRPAEISLGLEGAVESEGFHVIRGTW